jgi:hypothetical protein
MLTDRWRAISARIDGLARAAEAVVAPDPHSVRKRLGPLVADTYADIKSLASEYQASLPAGCEAAISEFDARNGDLFPAARDDVAIAAATIPLLIALQAEVAFALSDHQERIRSITERAFLHLRRVLVANRRERDVWLEAYANNETQCEKLGAAHLLGHGIFAFKVHADGGRTDLVFGEPIRMGEVAPAVEGLVLTEWKRANPDVDGPAKFAEARRQADIYAGGPLAGIELAGYRYLVVVSDKLLPAASVPDDEVVGQVVYRHINIPVDPDVPSIEARRH